MNFVLGNIICFVEANLVNFVAYLIELLVAERPQTLDDVHIWSVNWVEDLHLALYHGLE